MWYRRYNNVRVYIEIPNNPRVNWKFCISSFPSSVLGW